MGKLVKDSEYIINLHELRRWYRLFHPMVASIVVVRDARKSSGVNLMPAVWTYPISADKPYLMVGVAPQRHTYGLLREAEEFTVSILPASSYELVRRLGDVSGADVDKVKEFNLELEPSLRNSTPHLKDSIAWVEALKTEVIEREDWDHALFVGRVLLAAANARAFDEEELIWKVSGGSVPVTWLGGPYFADVTGKLRAR